MNEVEQGLAPEARVRASQLVFGPYSPWPVAFRVMGPNLEKDRAIAAQVQAAMLANPHTRQVNQDWGERAPTVHFVLDQARLQLIGLSSHEAAEQIQFLLTGAPVTQVREDIRTAEVVARSAGTDRFDPSKAERHDFDEPRRGRLFHSVRSAMSRFVLKSRSSNAVIACRQLR